MGMRFLRNELIKVKEILEETIFLQVFFLFKFTSHIFAYKFLKLYLRLKFQLSWNKINTFVALESLKMNIIMMK